MKLTTTSVNCSVESNAGYYDMVRKEERVVVRFGCYEGELAEAKGVCARL